MASASRRLALFAEGLGAARRSLIGGPKSANMALVDVAAPASRLRRVPFSATRKSSSLLVCSSISGNRAAAASEPRLRSLLGEVFTVIGAGRGRIEQDVWSPLIRRAG